MRRCCRADPGKLRATGWFTVEGGSLAGLFEEGVAYPVEFLMDAGADLTDFGASFSGTTDMRIVPEPAALMLLLVGATGLMRRRKK